MLVSLILNAFTALLRGIIDGFQRKASVRSLIISCAVLIALGGLLIWVGTLEKGALVVGIMLVAVAGALILLNTVFKRPVDEPSNDDRP